MIQELPDQVNLSLSQPTTSPQWSLHHGILACFVVALAWKLTLASYDTRDIPIPARSLTWRGPVAYLAFHCAFYGVFCIIFVTVGDLPW